MRSSNAYFDMATIVNTPGVANDSGVGGWIVAAVLIIAAVLIALFVWPGYAGTGGGSAAPTQVNVQVPALGGEGGGGAAGGQ